MAVISRHREHHVEETSWTDELGSIPLMVTLILPLVIGVVILLKCILNQCCLRKSTTKEEMFGVEGRMTMISNSESGSIGNNNSTLPSSSTTFSNHHFSTPRANSVVVSNNNTKMNSSVTANRSASLDPSRLSAISDAVDGHGTLRQYLVSSTTDSYETLDLTDSLKRSTVHRQLPDLPQGHNPPRRSSSVLSHDGTSELYATVAEVPNGSGAQSATAEESHLYSNIADCQPSKPSTSRTQNLSSKAGTSSKKTKSSEPNPSSDSETYGNSTHPYAKLKKPTVEHPYARVKTRAGSTETAGDEAEETDTDNYDVAHPYAQITARQRIERAQASGTHSNHTDESQSSTSGSANPSANPDLSARPARGASVESEDSAPANHPVPPRRTGRQWRRSHPQGEPQPNSTNDNQVHFSGDSQDSRGYTSISVREPLSNIRNQALPQRNYDSHYATLSDDSEEMYAAIEDPRDGNYMRIAGDEGRQFQALSNFERREANSPLPPVPPPLSPIMVSPSEVSPTGASAVGREGPPSLSPSPAPPPIYAQVTKKKKTKAPTTPSGSGTGTTILSSHSASATSPSPDIGPTPIASTSTSSTMPLATASSIKRRHHHAAILDPSIGADSSDPSRRWSKADISYSEFDIIREPCFPSTSEQASSVSLKSTNSTAPKSKSKVESHAQLDEDNYNVIADVRSSSRISKKSESSSRRVHQEDNYQEIDSVPLHHPYQEISGRGQGPSDYYQEISEIKKTKKPKHRDNTYQTIRGKNGEGEDSDDEDEDQFYEKVKVKPTTSSASTSLHPNSSTNPNIRKHGYEKLKRKTDEATNMTRVEIVISDEEDEDNEGSLYEQVKYPPYERLQESQDNLAQAEGDNLYEDIGYSRVTKAKKSLSIGKSDEVGASAPPPLPPESPTVDLDQLYARVDKTRKKKRNDSQVQALGIQPLDYDNDHSIEYI